REEFGFKLANGAIHSVDETRMADFQQLRPFTSEDQRGHNPPIPNIYDIEERSFGRVLPGMEREPAHLAFPWPRHSSTPTSNEYWSAPSSHPRHPRNPRSKTKC